MRAFRPFGFLLAALAHSIACAEAPPAERPPPPPPAPAPTIAVAEKPPAPEPEAPPAAPSEPPSKWAGCQDPPVGMACIPGGPTVIGSNDHAPREKPRHEVEVSTFYMDKFEVTNEQYEKCEQAKVCPRRALVDERFFAPKLPAVPITWFGARAYCLWSGKRLPTEAEWEKVARGGEEGRLYPWGDAPATCDRAQIGGCDPGTTKPVGSFPAGPYGVFDMAGNGYEWVSDWESGSYEGGLRVCGGDCAGTDPLGPCAGAPFCPSKTERVLRGGSFRWEANQARGSFRRFEKPYTGGHRLSARCAATRPVLATWPPLALSDPPPKLADPEAPNEKDVGLFRSVPDDTAVLDLAPCGKRDAKTTCHDPPHFPVSNELKLAIVEPFLRNIGGGYAGVGADQNYSLIATARSRWVWLFDYDPLVVYIHALLREVILVSPTPKEFVDAFRPNRFAETQKLVSEKIPPEDREAALRALHKAQGELYADYSRRIGGTKATFDWLQNDDHYRYIRLLYQQGRIQSVKGNLLTAVALPKIAESARKLGVPIRILYTSNAEDMWELTPRYRENLVGLPVDESSVFVRTVFPRQKNRDVSKMWKYVVHSALEAQRKMRRPGWNWTWYFDEDGYPGAPEDVVAIGLPGRTEREKAKPPMDPELKKQQASTEK